LLSLLVSTRVRSFSGKPVSGSLAEVPLEPINHPHKEMQTIPSLANARMRLFNTTVCLLIMPNVFRPADISLPSDDKALNDAEQWTDAENQHSLISGRPRR
jgi:hypothetical protein